MAWRIENYYYYAVPYGRAGQVIDWEVRRFLDPDSPDEYSVARVDCDSEDPDDAIHLAIARQAWRVPQKKARRISAVPEAIAS